MWKNNEQPTLGFAIVGLDVLSLSICNSIVYTFGLDGILLGYILRNDTSIGLMALLHNKLYHKEMDNWTEKEFKNLRTELFYKMLLSADGQIFFYNKKSNVLYEVLGKGYLSQVFPTNTNNEKKVGDRILDNDPIDDLNNPNLIIIPKMDTTIYYELFKSTFGINYPMTKKFFEVIVSNNINYLNIPIYRAIVKQIYKNNETYQTEAIKEEDLNIFIELVYMDYVKNWISDLN